MPNIHYLSSSLASPTPATPSGSIYFTSLALNRYRDEHVRALWFADRQAQINCARLTLDWGPSPGQKRLALAYLRLRRLLEVADRKEHTTISFIANFSEVRARCVCSLVCRLYCNDVFFFSVRLGVRVGMGVYIVLCVVFFFPRACTTLSFRHRCRYEYSFQKPDCWTGLVRSFMLYDRINNELRSRTPMELPTDADQLALMASFQTVTSDLPLLQWLHGGKV